MVFIGVSGYARWKEVTACDIGVNYLSVNYEPKYLQEN